MATSLIEQLNKLKTPQTSLLLQDKRKPSLIFDTKEAANLDKETVYNIGVSGLEELTKLCNDFINFKQTLFAPSSISLERSVQDQQVNKKLNEEIQKFLVYLSPYFLLNSAHKAIEWLIHRFHIHQFNKDSYILLILPYHESRIFVRAIQLLDLTNSNDKWHWLKPLQKTRTPLSPVSLAHQVVSDNGFLKLICDHVIEATEIYKERSNTLSTLYAFFTTALVECIEHSTSITEIQFTHMLPVLLKGLEGPQDFAASSYMIIAKIITQTNLQEKKIEKILLKAIKYATLTNEVMLLILFLYNDPNNGLPKLSEKLMLQLVQKSWFSSALCKAQVSGAEVMKFIILFLNTALEYIANSDDSTISEEIKKTVDKIFDKITLTEDEVLIILQDTLRKNVVAISNSTTAKDYFNKLYQSMETRYPASFDKYLHRLMQPKKSSSNVNRQILQFFMSWYSKAEKSLDIFTGLNHVNPEQRILAIKTIGSSNLSVPDHLKEIVNKSLLARFNDKDIRVIEAILNLPLNLLQTTFALDTLVDELIVLVSKCHSENKYRLAKPALKVLLELCEESDDTSVFLVAVPYLFPTQDKDVKISMQILKSDFAKRNLYFKTVAQEIGNSTDAKSIISVSFHNILNPELLPPVESILSAIKQQMMHGDAASVFFNMIILGSTFRVPAGFHEFSTARQAIEIAAELMKNFPSTIPLNGVTQIDTNNLPDALKYIYKGHLPLQVNTYVLGMVHRYLLKDLKKDFKFDFEEDFERSQLVLRLLETVFEGMTLEKWRSNHEAWTLHHKWFLNIFFNLHSKTTEGTIRLLSQFFIKPVKPETSFYCLSITLTLLDSCKSFQWAFHDDTFGANLILALSSENKSCREVAVNVLKKILQTFNISMGGYSVLFSELITRHSEISLDSNWITFTFWQLLSSDPDVSGEFDLNLRQKLEKAREKLFDLILSIDCPIHVCSQLLELLSLVNGPEILKKLVPLGFRLLKKVNEENKLFAQSAIKNILQRFDSSSVTALKDENVWNFFMECLSANSVQILVDDAKQYLSIILIKQVDGIFFDKLGQISQDLQSKFLAKLVDIVTDCETDSILSRITGLIKKLKIKAQLIVEELKIMITIEDENSQSTTATTTTINRGLIKKRRSISKIKSSCNPEIVNSRKWKRGITLLEFIQHSNNIENEELLVPVLFDLLKVSISFEEQSPVEYTNQLVLSSIHHLATKSIAIKNADDYIDLIAQCIRNSHNPQTHHHALLVLVELFKLANIQRALQKIMPIFTFMGNTVLRQDDAYSIQIISKTIETVVPIINAAKNVNYVCEILKLFITSLPDIPEHRRVPLFLKLLQLLDDHLHLYYLLSFESHVLSKSIDASQEPSEKLRFALSILQEFPVQQILQVCVKLVEFLLELPVEKEGPKRNYFQSNHIFDVEKNSPKHLRHYKFTIVRFLISLLSNSEFINRVAQLTETEIQLLKPSYDTLIVKLVIFIQNTSKNAELNQGKPNGKYWKVMLHSLYDVLDLVNNLLPNNIFIESVVQLISHESLTVKRKALELLNARLAQKKFSEDDFEDLLAFMDPITKVLDGPNKFVNPEVEVMQQTALISLKLLAKLLAPQYPDVFKPIVDLATELVKKRDGAVLGSAVLCVAELCSSMRIHAITRLNKFVPAVIRLLEKNCNQEIPDILIISIVSALQKIIESIGNFLSPYLDQLLNELARLNCLYTDSQHPKIGPVVSRLKAITQKLSSCVPLRVLLPAVNKTYDTLISSKSYQCIPPLMNILAESFSKVQTLELNGAISDLIAFFLKVLQFREEVVVSKGEMEVEGEVSLTDVTNVEESASQALVSLVLKLSEATFRPLYYKLYDWAARNPQYKQRNITFYRLSANIAECLKSLFVLFAGHFLKHAASLLTGNNVINCKNETFETTLEEESSRIELIEEILLTLLRVFSYDAHDFVNQERFETLMQPIVDQIENTMGTKEEFEKRAEKFIVPCIASFVGAIPDDSLHKQLVYQILLKTRHTEPHVRNTALNSLVEIARKLGEDFMPLLPETVPFLAELLEDDDEATEKNAQNAVRTLEEILGEPLQKYF